MDLLFSASLPAAAKTWLIIPLGGFVDDIGQFSAGSTGRHPGNGMKIYIRIDFDLFGMYFQDGFPAGKVRKFHWHPAVETARAGQRRIQRFRGAACVVEEVWGDIGKAPFSGCQIHHEIVLG